MLIVKYIMRRALRYSNSHDLQPARTDRVKKLAIPLVGWFLVVKSIPIHRSQALGHLHFGLDERGKVIEAHVMKVFFFLSFPAFKFKRPSVGCLKQVDHRLLATRKFTTTL